MADLVESLGRRYELLQPHLSELQRRLWLGAEAAELGADGVGAVARTTGVATDTVRRGRREVQERDVPAVGRSRRSGGGRKRAEVHDAALVAALEALIDPVTRGDPMSPLRWTSKSTRALARALSEDGHRVSDFVVRRLLKELGYSLQANAKTIEGAQHADRDTRRGLQEQRPGMGSGQATRAGEGPRLPRPDTGQGQPLRGLRRGHRHRLGLGGHRPRHRILRGQHHRALVADRGGHGASRRIPAADLRRRWGLQRLPHQVVEDRAGRPGPLHRPDDHRVPPAARHQQNGTKSSTGCSPTSP